MYRRVSFIFRSRHLNRQFFYLYFQTTLMFVYTFFFISITTSIGYEYCETFIRLNSQRGEKWDLVFFHETILTRIVGTNKGHTIDDNIFNYSSKFENNNFLPRHQLIIRIKSHRSNYIIFVSLNLTFSKRKLRTLITIIL